MTKYTQPAERQACPLLNPDRRVRVREILRDHLPLARSRFYELVKSGDLPPGDLIGLRARDWRLGDILEYRARCKASCEARERGVKLRPGPAPTRSAGTGNDRVEPVLTARRAAKAKPVDNATTTAAAKKRGAKPVVSSRKSAATAASTQ